MRVFYGIWSVAVAGGLSLLTACVTDPYTGEKKLSKAVTGAVIGGATGAAIGAATGGDRGERAAIGAGTPIRLTPLEAAGLVRLCIAGRRVPR